MIHSDAEAAPRTFDDPARIADAIVEKIGKRIVLALPLGLGKANHIANALYARAAAGSHDAPSGWAKSVAAMRALASRNMSFSSVRPVVARR